MADLTAQHLRDLPAAARSPSMHGQKIGLSISAQRRSEPLDHVPPRLHRVAAILFYRNKYGSTMFRFVPAILLLGGLAGCVQSEDVVLKNPTTGEIKECSKNSGASFFPIAQTMMDNSAARSCAAGYEAAGWQRMN